MPRERVAMMWQLALQAWMFKEGLSDEPRLRRDVVRTVRGEIDRDRDEPAYEQVARQIREAIATGALKPQQVLPGVRSLAADLGVNFNTIARAYRLLEEDGFVRIRDRSGAEVVLPARRPPAGVTKALSDQLWQVLMRMRQAGQTPATIRREVSRQLDRLDDSRESELLRWRT